MAARVCDAGAGVQVEQRHFLAHSLFWSFDTYTLQNAFHAVGSVLGLQPEDLVLQTDVDEIPTAAGLQLASSYLWNGLSDPGTPLPAVNFHMKHYLYSLQLWEVCGLGSAGWRTPHPSPGVHLNFDACRFSSYQPFASFFCRCRTMAKVFEIASRAGCSFLEHLALAACSWREPST